MRLEELNFHGDESEREAVIAFLDSVSAEPEIIFAFKQTGIIVTDTNRNRLSEQEISAWNNAIAEFYNPQ